MEGIFKKKEEELFALCKQYQEGGASPLKTKSLMINKVVELYVLYEALKNEKEEDEE